MRVRVVGVAVLAVSLCCGVAAAAQASRPAQETPIVSLDSAAIKASWKESWLTGKLRFAGAVSGPAELRASLRPAAGGKVADALDLSLPTGGKYSGELGLPNRLLPKLYRLTVSGTINGAPITPVSRTVRLKAPPEGVVDNAFVSAVKGGKPASTLRGRRIQMFARFHFVAPPKTRKLWAYWIRPDFKKVFEAKNKPYKVNTDTFVVDTTRAGLTKGVWFCYMRSSSGTIIKKVRVRIA